MWYCSSTAAVSACASASRKGPLGSARSGNVVERKEASGCEKRLSTSGAFSTGWWEGGRRYWLAFGSKDDGEGTDLESVVENEYDYAVHVKGDVCCVRHTEHGKEREGTHGVTSTSFPARKGSRMQRSGSLSLSCGRPICCTVSVQNSSAMKGRRERGPPQTLPVS